MPSLWGLWTKSGNRILLCFDLIVICTKRKEGNVLFNNALNTFKLSYMVSECTKRELVGNIEMNDYLHYF